MTEEELKKIAEQIKANLSIEELDDLERQYNEMYQRLKAENEKSSSSAEDTKVYQYNVEWCNGSTNVFGTFSLGSSPGSTTNKKSQVNI